MSTDTPAPPGNDWQAIGTHRYREDGDTIHVRLIGDLTPEYLAVQFERARSVIARCGYVIYLIDASAGGGMSPEVRRRQAEYSLEKDNERLLAIIYGAGLLMRTLAALSMRAARLISGRQDNVEFVRDEAEALRLHAERRTQLRARFT